MNGKIKRYALTGREANMKGPQAFLERAESRAAAGFEGERARRVVAFGGSEREEQGEAVWR